MNNRNVYSTIALISGLLLGCSENSSFTDSSYPINSFDDIPDLLEYYNVPGVSIALVKDFEIDQLLTYGVKNQNTLAPVTPDTLFQAASMSKSVAAVAAMKMAENGMIGLDDDINNFLLSWKVAENEYTTEEKVTLRRLLSHRAGTTVHGFAGYSQIDEFPSLVDVLNGQSPANSPAVIVGNTPGSDFSYSGGGFVIAQQALIDIAQQPFEHIVDDTVFQPLAMTNSTFNQFLSEDQIARASAGHDTNGQNHFGDYNLYPEMSAAGLWSTPQDLAKFLIELQLALLNQSNRVLTGNTVEEMIAP
ncbi:MAG: beta-lactamase family protein, partial [Gammaproteobacteria bacterium]|nr:beta-lactamase family protein [Gammaproteobacteria bacterium]